MNATGAVPVNTSSGCGSRMWAAKVSQVARRSRWRCTQPFGSPVVPEVKAISATSSAYVSTASKPAGLAAARSSSSPPGPKASSSRSTGCSACAATASPATRASASPWETSALAITLPSSLARSSGIVATTTPPARRIPNQQATSSGVLGPCSRTRLPGTSPMSSTSTPAMRSARSRSSA